MLVWLLIQNIIPEAIAVIIISHSLDGNFAHGCLLWLIYLVSIRLIWQNAIIVHGSGHTIAIALADKELSAINLTNILKHRIIADILRSLLPFHHIGGFDLNKLNKERSPERISLSKYIKNNTN